MRKQKQHRKSSASAPNPEEKMVADDVVIGGEDRLSYLPEGILVNILSRLSTKDAVKTCVLSPQWEFKWTKLDSLNFNDTHFGGRGRDKIERFSFFVDRVLMHCRSTPLERFYLSCSSSSPNISYDPIRINTWITAALRRNPEILLIDASSKATVLPRDTHYNCPPSRLKELIILSALTVRVPNDPLFSTITKIDFNHVVLLGTPNIDNTGGDPAAEDGGGGQLLVLKLPVLEYLNMFCCKWRNANAVKFEVPMLSSFNMTMMTRSYIFKEFSRGFVFTICGGSKLTDINLSGNLSESYDFLLSSPVQNASIKLMFFPRNWVDTGIRIATTLRQMMTLMFLELSGESINALNHAAKSGHSLPLFESLIHLKIHTTDYWCTNGAAVIRFINQAPVLQTLTVETVTAMGSDLRYYESTNTEGDGIIPDCFHSHLKLVKFVSAINCVKEEKDTDLIKFILENASVLEQLQFVNLHKRKSLPSSKIRELLLSFPRASSVAEIMFI